MGSQITGTAPHTSLGLHSAEVETLEELPGEETRDTLMSFKKNYRMVICYANVERLPYKEITKIMGAPVRTVTNRFHRGRKQLRGALHDVAVERGFLKEEKGDSPR